MIDFTASSGLKIHHLKLHDYFCHTTYLDLSTDKQRHTDQIVRSSQKWLRKELIEQVYVLQLLHFQPPQAKIPNRIVSLAQPWILLPPIGKGMI